MLQALALSGYRSFGPQLQRFPKLAKVTVLIGQNNSGKSNVLRFAREVVASVAKERPQLDRLAQHLPGSAPLRIGVAERISGPLPDDHRLVARVTDRGARQQIADLAGRILAEKVRLDGTQDLVWSIYDLPERTPYFDNWREALKVLRNEEVNLLWQRLTGQGGGSRTEHWEPETIKRLLLPLPSVSCALIPAIRRIAPQGSSDDFDGSGIIARLAKLQNPDVYSQNDRARFTAINRFLCDVTDRPDATIEIPHDRETILVHMDGKVLPIEALGSGIHEVIILAAAATVLNGHLVCMEEPELHLNPILQKKLIRYLERETTNQYLITTHSAALMDTPRAEIYHVQLEGGASRVMQVTSDEHRSSVCADLGYHPSDLLQANCVVWVEGPSDRLYINWWLRTVSPELIEGIHYSVMFYGGRLAAHVSNAVDDSELTEFISLRRLNRRGVMLIDSDRDKSHAPINSTKKRLQEEFNQGPGHAWITAGREVENYLSATQVSTALNEVAPNAQSTSKFGRYDHMLDVTLPRGKPGQASKLEVARYITSHLTPDLTILDLKIQAEKLKHFIHASNPRITMS